KKKYHQRSKVETIFSVIKRTMGDEIRSVKTVAQNNEMRAKIIGYNAARIVDMASSLFGGFLQSLIKFKSDMHCSFRGTTRHRYITSINNNTFKRDNIIKDYAKI
ncbi:MAG: hypothetical protein QXH93_04645, partial [Conexivisphaerales archaeon]